MVSRVAAAALLLALYGGAILADAAGMGRSLTASAVASSSSSASGGASASAYASAAAKGNVKALAEGVAEARQKGQATAYAEALADEARKDPSRRDAIASALAEATDLSKEDANRLLQEGNTGNIADAIATSRGGETTTTAVSVSQAITQSKPAIASAVTEAFSAVKGGGEAFAVAEVKVEAIGTAIAEAYALAEVSVSVVGDGYGAGEARADAAALATSFAEVLVDMFAKASNDYSTVKATYKTQAISEVIAEASASAYAAGSQTGEGFTSAFQESLARSVSKALVQVVGQVLAVAFGAETDSGAFVDVITGSEDQVTADSKSDTQSGKSGEAVAEGGATGSANQKCSGSVANLCCKLQSRLRSTSCRTFCDGKRCTYQRAEEKDGLTTVWDLDGKECRC